MDTATLPLTLRLSDLPLWRLLVALDDAERIAGPDSETARIIARHVQARLRDERNSPERPPFAQEVRRHA
jgi:hypothetical protein